MGKTDIRKENRQQSDNAESDRSMEKRSILKIKKKLSGRSFAVDIFTARSKGCPGNRTGRL